MWRENFHYCFWTKTQAHCHKCERMQRKESKAIPNDKHFESYNPVGILKLWDKSACSKVVQIELLICHWKGLETYISKVGSHSLVGVVSCYEQNSDSFFCASWYHLELLLLNLLIPFYNSHPYLIIESLKMHFGFSFCCKLGIQQYYLPISFDKPRYASSNKAISGIGPMIIYQFV